MKKIEEGDVHYIINANAGKQRPTWLLEKLQKFAPDSMVSVTRNVKELDKIFREQGVAPKVYVAVGGDGTVRKVMERILGTANMLGIIPTGSGNGLARELGIDLKPERLIKIIGQGEIITADVLKVNGRLGLNVSGIGFDAEVAYRFARLGIRGLAGYVLSSIQALWCFKLFYAHMTYGLNKEDGVYWMISLANSGQYGNNARIIPQALYNDGLMDIVLVKPFPPVMLPVFIFRLFTGRLKPSKYIKYIRTNGPVLLTYTTTRLHIDGDPVEETDETLDISLLPGAFKIVVPIKPTKSEQNE